MKLRIEIKDSTVLHAAVGTDGTVWAGGAGGLFELAAGKWKNLTHADGLSSQEVLSLSAEPNGTMWIGYPVNSNETAFGFL